jgi:hypothetical protein
MALDKTIQTSIHGRRLGLTKDGNLVSDGEILAVRGDKPTQRVVFYDDFLGDAIDTRYNFQEGTDSATSDFLILADQVNGRARIITGDAAGVDYASNGAQVDLGSLNWRVSNGGLCMECTLQADAITNLAIFVGFTDQRAALEMPWTLSGTTFTSNQTDGAGFLFDTAATTDTWRCVAVKADVDKTSIDTANAWAAATDIKLRVEFVINPSDTTKYDAVFYINDVKQGVISDAITPSVKLTPVIAAFSRTTAVRNIDVDMLDVRQDR